MAPEPGPAVSRHQAPRPAGLSLKDFGFQPQGSPSLLEMEPCPPAWLHPDSGPHSTVEVPGLGRGAGWEARLPGQGQLPVHMPGGLLGAGPAPCACQVVSWVQGWSRGLEVPAAALTPRSRRKWYF